MKYFKSLLLIFSLSLCLGFGLGCKGSGTLEQGGSYAPAVQQIDPTTGATNWLATAAPDKGLFIVDSAFDLAFTTVNSIFELERANRQLLWGISPDIKHTLDSIRPQAVEAVQKYGLARRAYLASPTPAGLTSLQTILFQIQNLASSAQSVMPK